MKCDWSGILLIIGLVIVIYLLLMTNVITRGGTVNGIILVEQENNKKEEILITPRDLENFTVFNLKEKIIKELELNLTPNDYNLVFNDKILDNSKLLRDEGILGYQEHVYLDIGMSGLAAYFVTDMDDIYNINNIKNERDGLLIFNSTNTDKVRFIEALGKGYTSRPELKPIIKSILKIIIKKYGFDIFQNYTGTKEPLIMKLICDPLISSTVINILLVNNTRKGQFINNWNTKYIDFVDSVRDKSEIYFTDNIIVTLANYDRLKIISHFIINYKEYLDLPLILKYSSSRLIYKLRTNQLGERGVGEGLNKNLGNIFYSLIFSLEPTKNIGENIINSISMLISTKPSDTQKSLYNDLAEELFNSYDFGKHIYVHNRRQIREIDGYINFEKMIMLLKDKYKYYLDKAAAL